MEQKMICDLNLVLSPKYPSVSTASVTTGLVNATNAHGHNCPTEKTFYSLDLKTTTTRSVLRMLVWPVMHPWQEDATLSMSSNMLYKCSDFQHISIFFFGDYNNISMLTVLFLLSVPGGVVHCSGSQRTCISTAHCNLRRAHRHPASSIH